MEYTASELMYPNINSKVHTETLMAMIDDNVPKLKRLPLYVQVQNWQSYWYYVSTIIGILVSHLDTRRLRIIDMKKENKVAVMTTTKMGVKQDFCFVTSFPWVLVS